VKTGVEDGKLVEHCSSALCVTNLRGDTASGTDRGCLQGVVAADHRITEW